MVVRRWLTPYEWGTPPIATVISSDRFITALALVLWTWTNLPVHLSLEMMIFVGVCYLHMCHLKPALLLALTPVFYVSVEAMLKKVCRPRMSLSEEEATFKSYSSEFGACCVVKCVSTDHIPPACPVCTEYQWWGLVQARRFGSSVALKMPPWPGAVPCLLMRNTGVLHSKMYPLGLGCLQDCLHSQKAYRMLSTFFFSLITMTLGFW